MDLKLRFSDGGIYRNKSARAYESGHKECIKSDGRNGGKPEG